LTDTLHVIVAHLPSRRGGKKKSDEKRLVVANRIKQIVDSVQKTQAKAAFIIMGDFNDRPEDESISSVLQVQYQITNLQKQQLYGLLQETNGEGSYKFQGRWQQIDHFFVNGLLLQNQYTSAARVVKESFMLEPDGRNAGETPFRTYNGPRYEGGYSDHLPIYLKIEQK
jgi:predicted extracellular nuclease